MKTTLSLSGSENFALDVGEVLVLAASVGVFVPPPVVVVESVGVFVPPPVVVFVSESFGLIGGVGVVRVGNVKIAQLLNTKIQHRPMNRGNRFFINNYLAAIYCCLATFFDYPIFLLAIAELKNTEGVFFSIKALTTDISHSVFQKAQS